MTNQHYSLPDWPILYIYLWFHFFMPYLKSVFLQLVIHAHGKTSGNYIYFYPSVWINYISACPHNFQLAGRVNNWCSSHYTRMYYTNLSRLAENTYLDSFLGLCWCNGGKKEDSVTRKKQWIENQDIADSFFLVFPLIPSSPLLTLETDLTSQRLYCQRF